MSTLLFNLVRVLILPTILVNLASACSNLDYGPTQEDKCERWWDEAAVPGSLTSGECVNLIYQHCPQMLDITLRSLSKKPLQTHVSVVQEFVATHKRKGKTITFDYKTTQELCVQVQGKVECSLWLETITSPGVPQVKVQQCRDLYNRFCVSAAAKPVSFASGSAGRGTDMNRLPHDWERVFGNKVSSTTNESEESGENAEHSTINSPSHSGTPGYFSSSDKKEQNSRKRTETIDTYHKQNSLPTDTSSGRLVAETGLHPAVSSMGGSGTTVKRVEERKHRSSHSSRTETMGYGTSPYSEHGGSLGARTSNSGLDSVKETRIK